MATTPAPLVWDFHREVGSSGVVGGVVHFYDETAQSLYNSGGLHTRVTKAPEGHWKDSVWSGDIQINSQTYLDMDLDHPYNGVVFGVGVTSNGQLQFLRYVYSMDCTYLVTSGTLNYSNSNSVAQVKANIMNTNEGIFMSEATLFQPGAKVDLRIAVGDEVPYAMCVAYLDSVDYNIKSSTVPISGRNTTGFKLGDSTFDDMTEITGLPHEVVGLILDLAGVDEYVVEEGTDNRKHEFNPDQTLLSGLEQLCEVYSGWKVVELPNGTIVVGSQGFVDHYQANSYYIFEEGSVFKRRTKRSSDAAYSRVRVTGKDAEGNDLDPVMVPVKNYAHWKLPMQKTYHTTAPDGLHQDGLELYAAFVAQSLQYVGVGEDFTGSLQPQLLIGDVAAIDNGDDTMTTLGLVTSIKHSFGKSGFTTDFSTDSGGILTDARSGLTTVTKSLNGYNRKQTLKDLIQVASGSSRAGPQTSGTAIKVVTSSNAQTLEGKTSQQIIDGAVAGRAPLFNLTSLNLPAIPVDGTIVEVTTDMTVLRDSLSTGPIKAAFQISTETETLDATLVIDPLYLPIEETYQGIALWYYDSSYLRLLFNFTPTTIYARIVVEA